VHVTSSSSSSTSASEASPWTNTLNVSLTLYLHTQQDYSAMQHTFFRFFCHCISAWAAGSRAAAPAETRDRYGLCSRSQNRWCPLTLKVCSLHNSSDEGSRTAALGIWTRTPAAAICSAPTHLPTMTEPPRGWVHRQDQLKRFSTKRINNQHT
jgi:hypothetical protein